MIYDRCWCVRVFCAVCVCLSHVVACAACEQTEDLKKRILDLTTEIERISNKHAEQVPFNSPAPMALSSPIFSLVLSLFPSFRLGSISIYQ